MFNLALNDILEVKFWYTCGDDRALNVRHYHVSAVSDPFGVLTSLSAANLLMDIFDTPLVNCMSQNGSFDAVSVQRLSPVPKTVATMSTNPAVAGTGLDAVLPRQVAGLISLATAYAGRKHRGRFYMPYPDEGDNTINGAPVAAYLTSLGLVRDALVNTQILAGTVGTMTLTPVIVHRDATPSTIITAGVVRSRWATQRRRQNARF